MRDLRARPPDPDADSQAYQSFLEACESQIARHPLWQGASPSELEGAGEALEKSRQQAARPVIADNRRQGSRCGCVGAYGRFSGAVEARAPRSFAVSLLVAAL